MGSKTLELRPSTVDKSTAARSILKDLKAKHEECGFLMCIGDGKTDEVVFQCIEDYPGSITCTVGKKQTEAHYYLDSVKDVQSLLARLSKLTL
jgi:trehalose 6-phosphate synthase/phosphatase